ncbi:MAG TPA: protein kinase [Thermoanaerobaculaceae bacterium]|nr:protein kinase [Thermoanaerobaculaceae bacterium]HRS16976.1 protein kinase [Thermoanaerobaculaceae bacterium]
MRGRTLLLAVALAAVLQAGVASAAVQWYEHYEAGLAAEEQGRWEEAVGHFRAALRLGPRPRARVATYGQNFLFDYDPFLHLAHCLIELERPDEAAEALRQSERFRVSPRPRLHALRVRLEGLRSASPADAGQKVPTVPVGGDDEPVEMSPSAPAAEPVEPSRTAQEPEPAATAPGGGMPGPRQSVSPTPVPVAVPGRATRDTPPSPAPFVESEAAPPVPAPVATREAAGEASPSGGAGFPGGAPVMAAAVVVAAVVAAIALVVLVRTRRRAAGETPATLVVRGETTQVGGGGRLGPYVLGTTQGRGGMATTYRATRSADAATVALKVPHESCLVDEGFRTRFMREGELGRALHHPNIVRIHDVGEDRGRPYLAMELLEGRTLKQELREAGRLPERRALEIVRAIAEALDYAHAKGVIHRDLKPENIMVLASGAIKVMDFGIARVAGQPGLTGTNLFLGTPLYAAPESVDARHVDHRADLYSLGIILFELLQGTAPFVSESPFRVLEMHMHAPLPTLSSLPQPVRPAVWAVVEKLCAKDRQARYDSAASLLVDVNRLLHDLQ